MQTIVYLHCPGQLPDGQVAGAGSDRKAQLSRTTTCGWFSSKLYVTGMMNSLMTPILRILVAALLMAGPAWAAEMQPASPVELIRRATEHEIKANDSDGKYMFRDRREGQHGSQTKLLVETSEATAGMVIANNDQPLTPEQRQAEIDRIERFVKNSGELKRKQKQEKDDSERIARIMKALPDAFLYEADGTEPGKKGVGKAGDELVRLKFHPNPKYSPPSRIEQVLTGMDGYILIDANQYRIAKIDGTLVKDVGFGWGILGHLDRGGHFLVEQGDVGSGDWEITKMGLSFTGRILLFKGLNIKSDEVYSDFRRVPSDLTFAQAVELLKKQENAEAVNTAGNGHKRGK